MDFDAGSGAPSDGTSGAADDPVAALRRAGAARLTAGDIAGGEALIDELVALSAAGGRADVDAWVHLLRARVAAVRGDTDEAGRLAARACAELLALGPSPAGALGLAALARLLDELRRFDEAVEALAIGAFFADQLAESSPLLVEACCELAAVFGELEVFEVAYRHAERAYVVTLPTGDNGATIDRCVALAELATRVADDLARTGDDEAAVFSVRARQAARLGLDLVARHDGTPGQRLALELALGSALVTAGDVDEAERVLTAALATIADDDDDSHAAALTGLGRARAADDPIRAIEHLTAALARCGPADTVLRSAAADALAAAQATVGRTNAAYATLRGVLDAEHAVHRHRRRRVAEVIRDRLSVVTDDRALVRRSRTFSTDRVTGLADRQHIEGALDELAKRWAGHDVGLLLLDVANLVSIRLRYDDEVADDVLRRLAGVLRSRQRGDDVVGRWSDATFCVLLPRCPDAAVERVADRLCAAIGAVEWADVAFGLAVSVATGTASAIAPFDLDALVLEAGASLAGARPKRAPGA